MRGIALGLAAVLCLFPSRRARAEDDAPPSRSRTLEIRTHEVGALTCARLEFPCEADPLQPDPVADQELPLFGGEYGEAVRPLGSVQDLIELVKTSTTYVEQFSGDPQVSLSEMGTDWLVIRAPASLQEAVATVLARLERETLVTATVDAVVLEGDLGALEREGGVAGAIARGDVRVVGGARTTGQEGHMVSAFVGRERAHLVGTTVEVAKEAKATDPRTDVRAEGFALQAKIESVWPKVVLHVSAWVAREAAGGAPTVAPSAGHALPEIDGSTVSTRVTLTPGAWTTVPLTRGRALALRATSRGLPRTSAPTWLSSKAWEIDDSRFDAPEPLEDASFPIRDLAHRFLNERGPSIGLARPDYTPPEPAELAEPGPAFEDAALVDLGKATLDPISWAVEGSRLDLTHGVLRLRSHRRAIEAMPRLLGAVRAFATRTWRFDAAVLRLPLASFPEWAAGLDDGAALLADGGGSLGRRTGAQVIDRAEVRLPSGCRNATWGGRRRPYVADYDPEVAEKASIAKPLVVAVLAGIALDVDAHALGSGLAVACQVRLDRSTWEGSRAVATEHGPIECPDLGLLRVRAGTVIPAGATRLVGLGIEGGEATLVLLTVTAD